MPFMPFVATGGAGGGMLSLGSGNFAGLVWSASGSCDGGAGDTMTHTRHVSEYSI